MSGPRATTVTRSPHWVGRYDIAPGCGRAALSCDPELLLLALRHGNRATRRQALRTIRKALRKETAR